jgi:ribosomal protein S19
MLNFLSYKRRSLWKGFFMKREKKNLYLSRTAVLTDRHVGNTYFIHNGKRFLEFYVQKNHVGYKAGQFFVTKKIGAIIHIRKLKKKGKMMHAKKNVAKLKK